MGNITLDQEYKTECGHPVELFTVSASGPFPVVGRAFGQVVFWDEDGMPDSGQKSLRLVKSAVAIDTGEFFLNVCKGGKIKTGLVSIASLRGYPSIRARVALVMKVPDGYGLDRDMPTIRLEVK